MTGKVSPAVKMDGNAWPCASSAVSGKKTLSKTSRHSQRRDFHALFSPKYLRATSRFGTLDRSPWQRTREAADPRPIRRGCDEGLTLGICKFCGGRNSSRVASQKMSAG